MDLEDGQIVDSHEPDLCHEFVFDEDEILMRQGIGYTLYKRVDDSEDE